MKFTIVTLFPEMFTGVFEHSIIARAQKDGLIEISYVNIRDFGIGPHRQVDDKPYGGGVGMVLRVDVLHKTILSIKKNDSRAHIILLDPKGKRFSQSIVERLVKHDHIVLICGHYEGFDERIKKYIDEEISLGDFVLTGGEIPAAAVVDAVARHVPGVLKKEGASTNESFSRIDGKRMLEHPHFTRPNEYLGDTVPQELLTGDPKIVEGYRTATKKKKPTG